MATPVPELEWHPAAQPDAIAEIVRLGEIQLEDQLATAIAADARAINQASIFAAIAGGLCAGAIAVEQISNHQEYIVVGLGIAALFTIVGSLVSRHAARPIDFYPRGYRPSMLAAHSADLNQIHKWVAEDLDCRLAENRESMAGSARSLNVGFWIAAVGLFVGLSLAIIGR